MKSLRLLFPAFLMLTVAFQSCTIEKRLYTKGYHIQRHGQLSEKTPGSKDKEIATEQAVAKSNSPLPSDTLLRAHNAITKPVAAPAPMASNPATSRAKDTQRGLRRNPIPSTQMKGIWNHAFQSERPAIPGEEEVAKEEATKYSTLAIVSMVLASAAILTYLLAIFVITGWAALGYAIISILLALAAFVVGMIAILLDSKTERKIPIVFYPLFGIVAFVALITVAAFLFSLV